MTGLARFDFTRPLGNGAHLATFTRVKYEQAVGLAPIGMAQDDGFEAERPLRSRHIITFHVLRFTFFSFKT
jgi:hypothetical protein